MFFLDVAVTATYFPLLSLHLAKTLALSPGEVSAVYAIGPLAALIGPPLAGWLADRLLPAELALSVMSTLRALVLLLAARADSFLEMLAAQALLSLVSIPCGVLCFTVAFRHAGDARGIGRTRVWGTVSWILTLWAIGSYMDRFESLRDQLVHTRNLFEFGAILSAAAALYAATLPATPPLRTPGMRAFAFVSALGMLRDPSFRALILAAVLGAACLQFHFILWPLFFTDARTGLGLDVSSASRASSVAQMLELMLFPAFGLLIRRWGLRNVLLAGVAAWPVRFLAYAVGQPVALVVGVQALHGVNVVCGTVAAQVAVDRVAPRDARASSQALLVTATSGGGNLLGQLLSGAALAVLALPNGGHRWPLIFLIPLVLGLLATWVVAAGFRPVRGIEPAPTRVLDV
jgi:MFS family permease